MKLRRRRRSSGARKKRIQAELFNRLKIKKEDGTSRLQNYAKEKYGYPVNYYKRINKYFGLNNSDKINNLEYEVLGKFMENELLKGGHLSSTDNNDFLNSLNVPLDEYSKKKRLNRFEDQLKTGYNENLSPVELESFIRTYFDLKSEKLNPNELERLNKIMKEELLTKKYSIKSDPISKGKRAQDHKLIRDKLLAEKLSGDDIASYYGLGTQTKTKQELDLLLDLLKGEFVDFKLLENQNDYMQANQIPADNASKNERYNKFKTDIVVTYEVGNLKYFIGKYFGKAPEAIADQELTNLFRIIRLEVEQEMHKEPISTQNELQGALNLMNNEIRIINEQKDSNDDPIRANSIKQDEVALEERLKRFNDTILPDYQSGAKKLSYRDRISIYFNMNLENYSPNEIEALGRLMDYELNENGIKFVNTDDLFLKEKHVDPNEKTRKERIKSFSNNYEMKIRENLKKLDMKNLMAKYYDIEPDYINDGDLIHFSTFMVDELLNDEVDHPKLETTKQFLKQKGLDVSLAERQKRRMKFKNEIEPELRSSVKNLDYTAIVAEYFDMDNIGKMNLLDTARLKRLMDREIRELDKIDLGEKYKIGFDDKAIKDRLKTFKDKIEPDYRKNLNELNYQARIATYFDLEPNQLKREDLEKFGKLMEDELTHSGQQFPTGKSP